ncbi:serine/threonine-protein phosphatase 7 long form homolog [Magnolia sinica]|uniref:serine/threonine-protein phosphatase 7 long form homolog n=1 Tax=Magnolia sinica TaxID=86752 RepID=UPI00265A1F14|nr:serine/threonine-protein phosphatase 7 long form homolog [Magnolia sinica]
MSLLSAMMERWHAETHTFHLPFGEWGITPYDIYMQLDLRYDGGSVPFEDDLPIPFEDDWMSLPGTMSDVSDFSGHWFRLLWLSSNFARHILETEAITIVKACALILYTMGVMIFCHRNELRAVPERELAASLEGFDASAFVDPVRAYSSWCE